MRKILLSLVVLIALSSPSFAEDLYFAQSTAGDTSADSCANAKPIANVAWGAGAGNVSAGDTLHLCGTITSTLTIGASGTDLGASAITIKWEDGAKFSKEAWGTTTSSAIYASSKSNLIFDGGANGIIENTGNGTGLSSSVDSTFMTFDTCSHVEVKNLLLKNMYVRAEGTEALAYGKALSFSKFHDINIHNNVITDGNKIVSFTYWDTGTDRDVLFHHNTLDNSAVAFTLGSAGANAVVDNVSVYNNSFHRGLKWSGAAAIHTDLTHTFAAHTGSSITNLKIYNNLYRGDCGSNVTTQAYVEANGGTIVAPQVYNNIFTFDASPSGSCGSGAMYFQGGWSNALVYGNTFSIGAQTGLTVDSGSGMIVKNNIFNTSGTAIGPFSSTSSISASDYNTFLSNSTFLNGSWGQMSLASWKSAHPTFEINSQVGDPSLDANSAPQVGSIAIDNGTILGAPYDYDKNGVARGATWDIGALENAASADIVPNAFSFTDQTGVALSTVTTSSEITVAGIDSGQTPAITISGAGCTYNIDGGAYTADAGTAGLDNVITARITSSGSYSTTSNCVVTIGGVSDTFSVTTLAASAAAVPQRFRGGAMGGRK